MKFFVPLTARNHLIQYVNLLRLSILATALVLLLDASPSSAGGLLHFLPCYEEGQPIPLERARVVSSRARIVVSDTAVEYLIDQTFLNNNDQTVECIFIYPYEVGSPPDMASLTINGEDVTPEQLPPEQFFPLLFELTRGMADPSLLELAGKGAFLVRHLSLGPRKEKSVHVRFFVRKKASSDLITVMVPLWGERFSLGPVAGFEILLRFKVSVPIKSIFSTTHEISVLREAPHRATISLRSQKKSVNNDLLVFAILGGTDFDASLLCEKTSELEGVFMVILTPPSTDKERKIVPKDVVFALDVSGSVTPLMRELSQQVVMLGLRRLGTADRFNIVTIGTSIGAMQKGLVPVTQENVIDAIRYLNSVQYGGGTDLYNGIMTSLEKFSTARRQGYVVLLTDGRPTVGILDPQAITEAVRGLNRYGAKIFSIALGEFADTALLWRLSEITKGSTTKFESVGTFESHTNKFYEGITQPWVRDISLDFENADRVESIPSIIPDISGDTAMFVFGSYVLKTPGPLVVKVRARVHGRNQSIYRSCASATPEEIGGYIPLLYAMRRVAKMVEMDHLKGSEEGLLESLRFLSEEYGFKQEAGGKYLHGGWRPLYWLYQTSLIPSQVEQEGFRRQGQKLFRRTGSQWVDTNFRPDLPVQEVAFLSNDYFDLIRKSPWLGKYFSLGQCITVVGNAKAFKVVPNSESSELSLR